MIIILIAGSITIFSGKLPIKSNSKINSENNIQNQLSSLAVKMKSAPTDAPKSSINYFSPRYVQTKTINVLNNQKQTARLGYLTFDSSGEPQIENLTDSGKVYSLGLQTALDQLKTKNAFATNKQLLSQLSVQQVEIIGHNLTKITFIYASRTQQPATVTATLYKQAKTPKTDKQVSVY